MIPLRDDVPGFGSSACFVFDLQIVFRSLFGRINGFPALTGMLLHSLNVSIG